MRAPAEVGGEQRGRRVKLFETLLQWEPTLGEKLRAAKPELLVPPGSGGK